MQSSAEIHDQQQRDMIASYASVWHALHDTGTICTVWCLAMKRCDGICASCCLATSSLSTTLDSNTPIYKEQKAAIAHDI